MKKINTLLFIVCFSSLTYAQEEINNIDSTLEQKKLQLNYDYYFQHAKIFSDSRELKNPKDNSLYTCTRDSLYNLIVAVLDSVHKIVKDDRVDSIWNFLRSRIKKIHPHKADTLGLSNFLKNGILLVTDTTAISLCPLFDGEYKNSFYECWGPCVGGAYFWFIGGYHYPELKHIAIYCSYKAQLVDFKTLAVRIYHEGYHAWIYHKRVHYANEDKEHEIIKELDKKIFKKLRWNNFKQKFW